MTILSAAPQHLPDIQHLITHGYTRLVQFGREDLPDLLARGVSVVGVEADQRLWGFVTIQVEPRPATLPAAAPDRAYVRGILLDKRRSPSVDTAALVTAALARLGELGRPFVVMAQSQDHWLKAALTRSGFAQVDQVRYYKFSQRNVPSAPAPAQLTPLSPAQLAAVAQLDAESFPPLWHMGEGDLAGLLFAGRMRAAWLEGQLVGYAAITLNGAFDDPATAGPSAFLARLAVHPSVQGRGVGRQLLADSIAYAHSQRHNPIYLNTQVSNGSSQRLYEGMGFRSMGRVFQVYVAQIRGDVEAGKVADFGPNT